MKKISNLILGLFISYLPQAHAALPPTTIKGQSETSPVTSFNLQAPYNQATTTAGVTRYVDSGNRNLLLNSSFEASTATTSWTATTATGASESSVVADGKKSYKLSFSASTGNVAQSVTPTIQMQGLNMQATCKVKTSLSTIQLCVLNAGSEVQCTNVSNSNAWGIYSLNFPGPASGSVGVDVKTSSSTTGDVYVDDCYVGYAQNVGVVPVSTEWTAYTPVFTGFGTVSFSECYWRRDDTDLLVRCKFTTGTTTAVEARVSFPGTLVSSSAINTLEVAEGTFVRDANAVTNTGVPLIEPLVSYFTFGGHVANTGSSILSKKTGTALVASAEAEYFYARAPIQGWQAQSAIGPNTSQSFWSGYMPIGASWSTASATFADPGNSGGNTLTTRYSQGMTVTAAASSLPGITFTPSTLGISYLVTASFGGRTSSAGNDAAYSLTDGTTIVSTINHQVGSVTPVVNYPHTLSGIYTPTSTSPVTLKIQMATTAGNAIIQNISGVTNSTSIEWSIVALPALTAPLLIGSVTSSSLGNMRIEQAYISNSATNPALVRQSGSWISAVAAGGSGAGDVALTFATGMFSAPPSCIVQSAQSNAASGFSFEYIASGWGGGTNTTATSFRYVTNSPVSQSSNYADVICMGPR